MVLDTSLEARCVACSYLKLHQVHVWDGYWLNPDQNQHSMQHTGVGPELHHDTSATPVWLDTVISCTASCGSRDVVIHSPIGVKTPRGFGSPVASSNCLCCPKW